MGKSKKSQLEVSPSPSTSPQPPIPDEGPLIPQHTKEASLALLQLFFFSILMFTLPFGVFYGVQHYLKLNYDMEAFEVTCWSVLGAVMTVNIVIGLYVWVAWRDAKKDEEDHQAWRKAKTN